MQTHSWAQSFPAHWQCPHATSQQTFSSHGLAAMLHFTEHNSTEMTVSSDIGSDVSSDVSSYVSSGAGRDVSSDVSSY